MAPDFSRMTVVELRGELKQRNLSQTGKKSDLIDRLNAFERDQPSETPDDPAGNDLKQEDLGSQHDQTKEEPQSEAVSNAPKPSIAEELPQASVGTQDIDDTTTTSAAPIKQEEQEDKEAPAQDSVSEGTIPKTGDADTVPAADLVTDAVSRKRRSRSPPPETESSRKRARPTEQTGEEAASESRKADGQDLAVAQPLPASQIADNYAATRATFENSRQEHDVPAEEPDWRENREATSPKYQELRGDDVDEPMTDYDRDVVPAQHPATSALYIKHFMRPLRESVLRDYLIDLAAIPGAEPNPSCVVDFFLDPIRTHAFVSFTSISAASRVRTALHGTVWPNERNRKELWVDFIPEDKVIEWMDRELADGGPRGSSSRWEVRYEPDDDGNITARLVDAAMEPVRRESTRQQPLGPPPVPSAPPRGNPGVEGAPLGPRGRGSNHYRQAPPPPPAQATYGDRDRDRARDRGGVLTTRAGPPLQYRPVPEDIAQRRLANIKAHITKDRHRDLGRPDEINRYTFEDGEGFVDRGKEAFIGIRPPHRERERRRMGIGRGGGNRALPPPHRRRSLSQRRPSRDDGSYRGGGRNDYDRYRNRDSGRDRFFGDVPRSRFDGQPLPTFGGGGGGGGRGGRRGGGGRRDRY
ncbi:hypothetical protein N658DRAFT_429467 [Parathielavia hyrcaniae]|uniref:SAP domain-containing protein n=1 Tax=Parathielavia hyrcaniae TaxID=113614 RepID=A0AAN6PXN4_9PEZI|nr:hypothetical protein N658DRAFT_429467 [Parathielavia hyrcaniae]